MQPIHTLHDFFERSGADVQAFHLGRRVEPCPMETLASFENGDAPWPSPWQGQARLGLVFRLGNLSDPLVWFLALPLDEQGLLVPAPRDAFLRRLLETLGRSAAAADTAQAPGAIDNLMQDNPLAFTPTLPFQAVMHAKASLAMGHPASPHLEPVEAYLSGQQALDWQALGLQGLADYVVRLDDATAADLGRRLAELPDEVLVSLCYCLEHVSLASDSLARALRGKGEAAAQAGNVELFCACVRAVSGAPTPFVGAWFDELLVDRGACGPDLLAAMAGRGWRHLEDAQRLPRFLTRLAESDTIDFASAARDLALIPRLRLPVLMILREAQPDSAIGKRLALLGH